MPTVLCTGKTIKGKKAAPAFQGYKLLHLDDRIEAGAWVLVTDPTEYVMKGDLVVYQVRLGAFMMDHSVEHGTIRTGNSLLRVSAFQRADTTVWRRSKGGAQPQVRRLPGNPHFSQPLPLP